jgi:hypothetical protein
MDQPAVLAMLSRVVITLPHLGGQGVLIPGGFVLTAAHSLVDEKERTPFPHLGAYAPCSRGFIARNPLGMELVLVPTFIDLISDVAILEPSAQIEHYAGDTAKHDLFSHFAFEERASTPELLVDLPIDLDTRWRKAWVHIHQKGWQAIRVQEGVEHPNKLIIESEVPIGSESSGGPIVTRWGKLIGVISNELTQKKNKKYGGSFAHVAAVVPTWYHWEIEDQEEDEGEGLD